MRANLRGLQPCFEASTEPASESPARPPSWRLPAGVILTKGKDLAPPRQRLDPVRAERPSLEGQSKHFVSQRPAPRPNASRSSRPSRGRTDRGGLVRLGETFAPFGR